MRLRPLAMADGPAWRELKDRNRGWLSRWEATVPPDDHSARITYRQMVRRLRAEAMAARMLPFAIDYAVEPEDEAGGGSGVGGERARAVEVEAEDAHGQEQHGQDQHGQPQHEQPPYLLDAFDAFDSFAGRRLDLDEVVAVDDATGMATARPDGTSSGGPGPAAGLSGVSRTPEASGDPGTGDGKPVTRLPHPHHHRGRRSHRPDYRLVGQLTVSSITWGSLRSANIGYWIDEAYAGRDIVPTAVALAVDHCFQVCLMHRLEVCIRPENLPSLRVVEKLGFRPEGLRQGYLHIDGAWRDHASFALTAEEVPEGMLERWHTRRSLLRGS